MLRHSRRPETDRSRHGGFVPLCGDDHSEKVSSLEEPDMPQILSRVTTKGNIEVGAHLLAHRTQFTTHITEVIAHLSHIDGDWGTIFSTLLKSDIVVGTAAFQAFSGLNARQTALYAVADKALRTWERIALQAVWNQTKAARNTRNDFVHHVWGTNSELPQALLLMDSSVVVDFNISRRQRVEVKSDGSGIIRPQALDRSKIFVYREGDFKRAVDEARKAAYVARLLYPVLKPHRQTEREKARRELLSEPRFQRAVQPLIRGSSPEVQAQLRQPTLGEPPPEGTWD